MICWGVISLKINRLGVDNTQKSDFCHCREGGSGDYLFVLFKSPAVVMVNGKFEPVNYGDCILFGRSDLQHYKPTEGEFVHDYIHFEFENQYEESVFGILPQRTVIRLRLPELLSEVLQKISQNFYSAFPYKTEVLNHLGQVFLFYLKQEAEQEPKWENMHEQGFVELRADIYNQPQYPWSIEEMSKRMHMSSPHMQMLYKRIFKVSCMRDVIRSRIELAKRLLLNSRLRVEEISFACGYHNVEHFIRQFKKEVGMSPMQYRKK